MTTEYNPETIKAAASDLSHVMDDTSAFTALQAPMPTFGNFDLAQWLEQVVDKGAADVVAHTEDLKGTLTDIGTTLTEAVNALENVDKNNAERITASVPLEPEASWQTWQDRSR